MSYKDKEKNAAYAREWYHNNKERLLASPARRERNRKYAAEWRRSNRKAAMLSAAKSRAKQHGFDFNITAEDIIIPDTCPILNIPLAFTEGLQTAGTPALDRVDNSLGYIKGNVKVISHKANLLKADLCVQDVERLLDYMRDLK